MAKLKQLNGNYMGQMSEVRPAAGIFTADWWAVPGKTALAAYQAVGAASQSAAKINLANPGTNDLDIIDGTEPGWDGTDGFKGVGTGAYDTLIVQNSVQTSIVRATNVIRGLSESVPFGADNVNSIENDATQLSLKLNYSIYSYGGEVAVSDTSADGIYCISTQNAYKNGIDVGEIPSGTTPVDKTLYLLATHTGPKNYFNGDIMSAAFYVEELTPAEIAALTTRMAAL